MCDIDLIRVRLEQRFPDIRMQQLVTTHPGDDNGLWYVSHVGRDDTLQLESPTGNCPFLIEYDTSPETSGRFIASTADEAIEFVSRQIARWDARSK